MSERSFDVLVPEVKVRVKDNGAGITETERPGLFDRTKPLRRRGGDIDTVGLYVCADFGCSARAREPLPEHRRPADGVPDTRVEELRERIGAFVARVTGS